MILKEVTEILKKIDIFSFKNYSYEHSDDYVKHKTSNCSVVIKIDADYNGDVQLASIRCIYVSLYAGIDYNLDYSDDITLTEGDFYLLETLLKTVLSFRNLSELIINNNSEINKFLISIEPFTRKLELEGGRFQSLYAQNVNRNMFRNFTIKYQLANDCYVLFIYRILTNDHCISAFINGHGVNTIKLKDIDMAAFMKFMQVIS